MVSSASITAFIVNIIISFGLLLGFMLYLLIKHKRTIIPILVGAGVFILFQLITRIPLLGLAAKTDWYAAMTQQPWLFGIFLGLTAGIFEEGGRLAGISALMRKNRRWIDGVAFGVGHGGVEAVTLVGFTYVNNLVLALLINNGSFDTLATMMPAETANLIVTQLTQTPADVFFLAGAERICAFAIQIALSILVLHAVSHRKYMFIPIAVLLHMLVDAPTVIFPQVFGASIYGVEIFVAAMAVLAVVFIGLSKRLWRNDSDMLPPKNN